MTTIISNAPALYVSTHVSGNYKIDDLLESTHWGMDDGQTVSLRYSFPTVATAYQNGYGHGEQLSGFATLTSAQQTTMTSIFGAWAALAKLQFTRVEDNTFSAGDIRVAYTTASAIADAQAYAYQPYSSGEAGDIWLNASAHWDFAPGAYGNMALLHEVGHALGLSHPFEDGLGGTLPAAEDGMANTLMSYSELAGVPNATRVNFYPTTPMAYDIAAVQYLYGANTGYHSGDDTYTFTQGKSYFQTIWDGGGNDTIVWSTPVNISTPNVKAEPATIDLRPGQWSDLGNSLTFTDSRGAFVASSANTVQIYTTVTIENAVGGFAADTLIGNAAANSLSGSSGNDMLTGNAGNDTLDGGTDVDTAVYNGVHADYTLTRTSARGATLTDKTGLDGTDMLYDVERLKFADGSYAIDMRMDEAGGKAALLIGAFFGPSGLADTKEVGVLLSYLQQTTLRIVSGFPTLAQPSITDGADFLLNFSDFPAAVSSTSNRTFVSIVYKNVVGQPIDAATLQVFTDLLDSHALTQGQLLGAVATLPLTQTVVDLVGLAAHGMPFAPYG